MRHNQFQRFIATILLLSFTLQSCNKSLDLESCSMKQSSDDYANMSKSEIEYCTAVIKNDATEVETLLTRPDVDPNKINFDKVTALAFALIKGHAQAAQKIIQSNKLNPNIEIGRGRYPLNLAVEKNNIDAVKQLLNRNDIKPNTIDSGSLTPLVRAIVSNNIQILQQLLNHKDINPNLITKAEDKEISSTVIGLNMGNNEVISQLLTHKKLNINSEIGGRWYPLTLAINNKNLFAVDLLLKRQELNLNLIDSTGQSPIRRALEIGDNDIIQRIVTDHRLNVNAEIGGYWYPLTLAIEKKTS